MTVLNNCQRSSVSCQNDTEMCFSFCTGGTRKIAMNIFDIILEMWKFERHSTRMSSGTSPAGMCYNRKA